MLLHIARGQFTSSKPPRNFWGVTYTPEYRVPYAAWRYGKIERIASTELEAWGAVNQGVGFDWTDQRNRGAA